MSHQKWTTSTNAKGLFVKLGRGGGTFAHKDIAFKFASWISVEFELYIIKDYQRLKDDENSRLSLEWKLKREISRINYKIHTDAIKKYLSKDLTSEQLSYKYASEADMLNVTLFNKKQNNGMMKIQSLKEICVIMQVIINYWFLPIWKATMPFLSVRGCNKKKKW